MARRGYLKKVKGDGKEQMSLVVPTEMHQQFRKAAAFAGFPTVAAWMRSVLGAAAAASIKEFKERK
jgi:hypothetical protein